MQNDCDVPCRKKMKIRVNRRHQGVTWAFWGILGPLPYLGNRRS